MVYGTPRSDLYRSFKSSTNEMQTNISNQMVYETSSALNLTSTMQKKFEETENEYKPI